MTVPSLQDYEYQYEDTGMVLNSFDAGVVAELPFIDVTRVAGLDSPEFRTATRDHEGLDGGFVDAEFMTMRTVVVECVLYANPTDPEAITDTIRYNFRPGSDARPFYFKHPGKPVRVVFGKALGARYDVNELRRVGRTEAQLTIQCPDPYIYDADVVTTEGNIAASPGTGIVFNMSFNLTFGGTATGDPGGADVINVGNHDMYPLITIFGPVVQPTIVESNSGKWMGFDLTLTKTDYLVIDTRKHTIYLNGIQSRRSSLVVGSSWFSIAPGDTTIFFYGTAGVTGTASGASAGTTSRLITLDADASDISIGDRIRLTTSTGVLKEPTVFTVYSMNSAFGFTNIDFTPNALAATATGDLVVAGVPYITVEARSTWY
jgi:phage-related protein